MKIYLSVVIPAYNEEDNIEQAVLDVANRYPEAEIIVVNDRSTDRTLKILEGLQDKYRFDLKILTNGMNMGHGYSVVRGLRAAIGDYVLYIDADRQIDIDNFIGGFDVVSGYRVHRNDKPFRKVISFCLKMTNLLRFGYYIRDANCPFKIYKKEVLQELLKDLPDTCIIPIACMEVLARKAGFVTVTIPTPHKAYDGQRVGFLQSINPKMFSFIWKAFLEIVQL